MRVTLKAIAGVIFLFGSESSIGMTVDSAKSSNDEVFLPALKRTVSQKEDPSGDVLAVQSNLRETSTESSGNLVPKTSSVENKKTLMFVLNEENQKAEKDEFKSQYVSNQLEEINVQIKEVGCQINEIIEQIREIKCEMSAAYYYIQKDEKQIDVIQKEINEVQKQIDETRRMIWDLQQQVIFQNQVLDVTNKRINEINQQMNEIKNIVATMYGYLVQSTRHLGPLGFNPQPSYPMSQGVMPQQPPMIPMQQSALNQQKSYNQPRL